MVTIQNASIYSVQGEVAYQIDYSNGVSVRSVEGHGKIIRVESKIDGIWLQTLKPYKVMHNKKRNGERIKAAAIAFCQG